MLEITVPETKPATEWVNGRALQKMNPRERHSRAQSAFLVALLAWARDCGAGRVGLSYGRVGYDDDESASIPTVAPNAVVEILSPGDARRDVDEKIRVYLAAGTEVAFIVNPVRKTVDAHSPDGIETFYEDDIVAHRSLAGFALPASTIFEKFPPRK